MKVTVYDKNPGPGFDQWWLKTFWLIGCWLQKLFGKVDAYYGASSWADALTWLANQKAPLTSIQYWGHGSPGQVWLAQMAMPMGAWTAVAHSVRPDTVIWFRTCSTFQGKAGFDFSKKLSDMMNCTVAGHTRVIGPLQGGLHTRKPRTDPSWPITEAEFPKSWWPSFWRWGNNTVTCLATKIPAGW